MPRKVTDSFILNAAVFTSGGLIVSLLSGFGILGDRISFALLSAMLLVFIIIECNRVRRLHSQRWLINPVVICGSVTFVIGYGMSNILFFLPPQTVEFLGLIPEVSKEMIKHQYLAVLAVVSLFLGYWAPLGSTFSPKSPAKQFRNTLLSSYGKPSIIAIPVVMIVAVVVRLFAIRLQLYGYAGDYTESRQVETNTYLGYLTLGSVLGNFGLVLASLKYYGTKKLVRDRAILYVAFSIEVIFGVMSGMKSGVVMPFLIICMANYLCTARFPRVLLGAGFVGLFLAYFLIEPFRAARNEHGNSINSFGAISDIFVAGFSDERTRLVSDFDPAQVALKVVARTNLSYIGSPALVYADSNQELPEGSPEFMRTLLLSPFYAVVPRLFWDNKPVEITGNWYTREVLGLNQYTSTAMGPLAYLYFAGGYTAVCIFFLLYGMFLRWMFFQLKPWQGLAGGFIFLSVVTSSTMLESSISENVVWTIRRALVALLIIFLLFDRCRTNSRV